MVLIFFVIFHLQLLKLMLDFKGHLLRETAVLKHEVRVNVYSYKDYCDVFLEFENGEFYSEALHERQKFERGNKILRNTIWLDSKWASYSVFSYKTWNCLSLDLKMFLKCYSLLVNLCLFLTHYCLVFSFYTPWKHQKKLSQIWECTFNPLLLGVPFLNTLKTSENDQKMMFRKWCFQGV